MVAAAHTKALQRKVRAPQGRMVANGDWGRPQGKCHRKQTARKGKGETVR